MPNDPSLTGVHLFARLQPRQPRGSHINPGGTAQEQHNNQGGEERNQGVGNIPRQHSCRVVLRTPRLRAIQQPGKITSRQEGVHKIYQAPDSYISEANKDDDIRPESTSP